MEEKNPISERLNQFENPRNQAREFFEFIWDLAKTGIVVIILALLLRNFVIQPYIVDGESMMKNFVNNEYLLVEKISYLTGDVHRGDVIVFHPPQNPSTNYIKRVVGLPGEKVLIDNNKVTITEKNGTKIVLSEPYLMPGIVTKVNSGDKEITVTDNHFFVLGDNREKSSDSREWGLLPKENIVGRTWITLLPFDRFGLHSRFTY
ncbi:MAG: signal peptidase I [Candidatus Berkelbacteria bacterium]